MIGCQDDVVQDERRRPEKPDSGTVRIGDTVKLSYVDQSQRRYRPEEDGLGSGLRQTRLHRGRAERDPVAGSAVSARVRFKGPDQQKPAGVLSGGERNRLQPRAHPRRAAT